jgi:hypothetical protein
MQTLFLEVFFFACLTKNGNKCVTPLCVKVLKLKKKLFVFSKNVSLFVCFVEKL